MKELKFKTWFPDDPVNFQSAHMTESWTIEDIALNYDGGECMYFGTETNKDDHNDLIGLLRFSDKIKNYENRKYTIRQYTGRKDKNGVDIYYGDIVRLSPHLFHIGLVEWCKKDLAFIVVIKSLSFAFGYYNCEDIEIIGNIYENSELLHESLRGDANEVN